MERIPTPESSNLSEIAYDSSNSMLVVTFQNGGIYEYFDVPEHVWQAFKTAESKGKFLAASIKGHYRYSKV